MLMLLQGEACLQAAPIMFLYMQHPHKPLPAAAHTLFCAVIKQTDQVQPLLALLALSPNVVHCMAMSVLSWNHLKFSMTVFACISCHACSHQQIWHTRSASKKLHQSTAVQLMCASFC